MIRTFLAVQLEDSLRANLVKVQDALRAQLRKSAPDLRVQWVRPDSLHLTLKFLGDVEESQLELIRQALRQAMSAVSGFAVDVGGLGGFPDLRAPRVLWIGTAPTGNEDSPAALLAKPNPLVELAAAVDRAMAGLDFPMDTKPFHPHLTVARVKDRAREIGRALAEAKVYEQEAPLGRLTVGAVSVMKSDLRSTGAVYTCLQTIPLG
ncbi:MAG: RNA 2',3'-cyclic phosphodiesterase [Nitrospirales bacterium]